MPYGQQNTKSSKPDIIASHTKLFPPNTKHRHNIRSSPHRGVQTYAAGSPCPRRHKASRRKRIESQSLWAVRSWRRSCRHDYSFHRLNNHFENHIPHVPHVTHCVLLYTYHFCTALRFTMIRFRDEPCIPPPPAARYRSCSDARDSARCYAGTHQAFPQTK